MAINPPSDIVLGAILAADPSKYRAAADRLRRAGGNAGSEFATTVARASGSASTPIGTGPETVSVKAQGPSTTPGRIGKPPEAFAQLEAFVLQSFIQTMLPKNSQTFFGKGTAGEVWKSMLAEKLGAQIASSGQVGLATRLAAGRSTDTLAGSTLPAAALGGPVHTSSALMSILPYIKSSAAVDDTLAGDNASAAERS